VALIFATPGGIQFVDMWSVRRRVTLPSAQGHWAPLLNDRRRAETEAMLMFAAASGGSIEVPGTCRANEAGPAVIVMVEGLKDRRGVLRLDLYPDNDKDFLADDKELMAAGKSFARVDLPVPQAGPVSMCIRVPRAGTYSLSLLHDRDGNMRFNVSSDGVGFPGNPTIGWGAPKAREAVITAGEGLTRTRILLNYFRGLRMQPIVKP